MKMIRLGWMLRNPAYLERPEDEDEKGIDPLDLTSLESSSASIATVPAEDEDAAEEKNFPALESDHSTKDEGGIDASGLS